MFLLYLVVHLVRYTGIAQVLIHVGFVATLLCLLLFVNVDSPYTRVFTGGIFFFMIGLNPAGVAR